MAVALLSVGFLGLLVFVLGWNVSRVRGSVMHTQAEHEADPKSALRKAVRAHGNCIEYAPTLALLILALGLRMPMMPTWIAVVMILAVIARYIHAAGVLTSENIHAPNKLKFVGALLTYVTGSVLSILLVVHAARLF
ncbi:MAG TPA: MAPEG family protein [Parvularculaceae bacterium]|nr:MAPEG family protein [Parvularculaceae bacterium]